MTPRFDPVAGGELSARNNRCTMRPFEEVHYPFFEIYH